jgi:hypothetical protein
MIPDALVRNILGDWREDGASFVPTPRLLSAERFARMVAGHFGPAMTRSSNAACCGVMNGGSFHVRFMGTNPPRNVWFEYPSDRPALASMTRMDFSEREPYRAMSVLPDDPTGVIADAARWMVGARRWS